MSDYSISATITADDTGFQKAIQETIAGLNNFGNAFATMSNETKASFANLANQFNAIDAKAKVWGDTTGVLASKQQALKTEINRLIDQGITPESKQIQDLKKSYDSLGSSGSTSVNKIGASFASLRDIMQGPIAAFQLIKQGLTSMWGATIGNASKIEDMTAAFTPLVGGAENAVKMIAALNKEAATTPYELEGIGKVAKQLLPVLGNDVEAVTKTFRMLGDTAGGNIEKLDSITRGYVKVLNTGKVSLEALNMISDAGVPIQTQLAESMGMTVQEMYKLITAGDVSSAELTKAFQKMTSEGGLFYNGMETASKTLSGRLSTMQDNFKQAGAAIGDVFLPMMKAIVSAVSEIVGGFVKWATENDNLATTLKMIAAIGIGIALSQIVTAMPGVIASIQALKVSIVSLNTAALFGPTGIIVALGLVVAALIGVGNAVQQSAIKEITTEFKGLMEASKLTAEQIQSVQEAMANASKGEATFDEAQASIKQMSEDLGVSEDKVIAIGLASSRVTDEYKKTLKAVQDYNAQLAESNKYIIGTKEWIAAQKQLAATVKDTAKVITTVSEDAAKLAISWNDKVLTSTISSLEKEKKAAIQLAKDKNESVEEVARIAKYYDDKILESYKKSIEAQRTASLAEAKEKKADAKTIATINKYYDDQITEFTKKQIDDRTQLEKDYTKTVTDENKNRTKRMREELKIQDGVMKNITDSFAIYWADVYDEVSTDAADWTDTFKAIGNTIKSGIGQSFQEVGRMLVSGGGFEEFGRIALKTLSEVLSALGAQLIAIAATKAMSYQYAEAMAAGAAGAAALVASGIAGAMANVATEAQQTAISMDKTKVLLMEILRAGRSSYEDYLGQKQVEDYRDTLTVLQAKENQQVAMVNALGAAYNDMGAEVMSAIFTMGIGNAIRKAQLQSQIDAQNQALKVTQNEIAAMKEVYGIVYENNVVTAESSEILQNWAEDLKEAILASGSLSTEVAIINENYQQLLNDALYPTAAALDSANETLKKNKTLWTDASKSVYAYQSILSSLRNTAASFYESFADIGSDIASSLVDGLTGGLDTAGFMSTMKEYITKMVIQTAVYTDALTSKIASIGAKIASAIASGVSAANMGDIVGELKAIYTDASNAVATVSGVVASAFSSQGYATGTNNASRGWHMVGEQGPELAYFGGGERVMNARDTATAVSSNKSVTVNATFNSPKAMNQYEQMRLLRQYNRDLAFRGAL